MTVNTETYKVRLEKMLSDVTKELEGIGIHNPKVKEDWIATPKGVERSEADPNVGADRSEDWLGERGVLVELEARYNNINHALKKIEDGAYGVCEIGGEDIEEDRIEANPAARTCSAHMNDDVSTQI